MEEKKLHNKIKALMESMPASDLKLIVAFATGLHKKYQSTKDGCC